MVRLSAEQMREWDEQGFVVIPIPSGVQLAASVSQPTPPHPLTTEAAGWGGGRTCLAAARQLQARCSPSQVSEIDSKGNHWRLLPATENSYWCQLDHSLPFLQTCVHTEVVELGRQLAGHDDIWMRNAGINELAPGRQAQWHHDGGDEGVEFMHVSAIPSAHPPSGD